MIYGMLNLGSLLFGFTAWIIPVINLTKSNKGENKNWFILSLASVSSCAVSLCLVIFYIKHLVNISDWSALTDTVLAFSFISTVLLVVTILLNAVTVFVYLRNNKKEI